MQTVPTTATTTNCGRVNKCGRRQKQTRSNLTGLVQCANSLVVAEVSEVKGANQLPRGKGITFNEQSKRRRMRRRSSQGESEKAEGLTARSAKQKRLF